MTRFASIPGALAMALLLELFAPAAPLQAAGASVTCLDVTRVICYDRSTRRRATLTAPGPSWDCADGGLALEGGDRLIQYVYGTATAACSPIGGAASNLAPSYLQCLNLDNGTRAYPAAGDSWDCEAAGMVVADGQRVRMTIDGTVLTSCDEGSSCLVFLTSTLQSADFGGLAGGDAICQAEADAAGLSGRTFKAWLSDSATHARDRLLQPSVPLVRPDGEVLWDDWADMVSGAADSRPAVDPQTLSGAGAGERVWTGTVGPGTGTGLRAPGFCGDWTSTAGSGLTGVATSSLGPAWSADNGSPGCGTPYRLYCFEQ